MIKKKITNYYPTKLHWISVYFCNSVDKIKYVSERKCVLAARKEVLPNVAFSRTILRPE